MMGYNTLVINCFAGPGAGKTTAAFYIACELKKRGYVTEYVPEYAKELVWEKNYLLINGSVANQQKLLAEQKRRIDRLNGQVEFVVTDSPLLLNYIYLDKSVGSEATEKYLKNVLKEHNQYQNFNLIVLRDNKRYEKAGRLQDIEESIKIDNEIKNLLDDCGIYYGKYRHDTLGAIIDNVIKTSDRLKEQLRKKAHSGNRRH